MAVSQYYVDPAINANSGIGTSGDPFGDLQYALNTITRNSTDGDQINIKAGTAEALAANLSLATYGTPTAVAPLVLRGYTSAADDGGVGVINGSAAYGVGSNTVDYFHLIDLRITNSGATAAVTVRNYCSVQNCEIDTGGSIGVYIYGTALIDRCYIHDFTSHAGVYATGGHIKNSYVKNCGSGIGNLAIALVNPGVIAQGNVVVPATNVGGIRLGNHGCHAIGNTVYASGSTASGILAAASTTGLIITNNIIQGFSGAGGKGISVPATCVMAQYHSNAAYNNTTNFDVLAKSLGVTGNNDALGASPFVDAAAGDFDINGTQAGVTEDGWPSAFLGATSTTPKIDKGASQAGVPATDYPTEANVRAATSYGGGAYTGTLDLPAVADVQSGVTFDGATKTGTFAAPAVGDVQSGVTYGAAAEYTGTLALPTEAQVESGVGFGASGTEFTGTLVTGGADPDWTADEKAQIRQALGVTGTKAATSGGNLDSLVAVAPDNKPTVSATGEASVNVTLWKDATAPAMTGDAFARLGAPAGASVSADIAAIDDNVWSYATRTLTQSSTSTTDSTAAGSIARRRGDSWSISLTVGTITGYTSLWFTAKRDRNNTDAQAVLQIKLNASGLNDGLLYVNGAAATDDTLASITVSDASTGAIVIAVDETVTDDLPPAGIYYDVQALVSGTVSTLDSGTLTISADVTRAVA